PPPPPPEGEAPAWGEPVKSGPGVGFSRDDPPPVTPSGVDGFLGGAPDVVIVSARQTSQKFSLAEPKIEQDPERARRAGDVHTLAESIVHMANLGVKVLNISVVACQSVANLVNDAEIGAAVRYAAQDRDVLIVSAAGNNEQQDCTTQNPDPSPADPTGWDAVKTIVTPGWYSDYVLTVSATDNQGVPLPGQAASMHGPWISLAAPGEDIEAVSTDGRVINASVDTRNNSIKPLAGSSFAAAIVSSVAALVRAKFPQLSAYQIRHRLEASAHPPPAGHDTVVGYGVVNPVGALTWDIPAGEQFPPARVTTSTLHPPPPPAPADPRPGRAVLWGGLATLAGAGAVAIATLVRRRRRAAS
ncbi:S8 family serine peptidase, partial [Mycobacterium attenuatum]|uniref:S8 family serine peptidase n=1 Tax=Mycobacterium attenuatum TaxID=2341086 RepID=UPI001B7D68E4